MALSHQQLEELYGRYLRNQCTRDELQILINELGEESSAFQQEKITQLFDQTWDGLKAEPGKYPIKNLSFPDDMRSKIVAFPSHGKRRFALYAAAAVFLIVASCAVILYSLYTPNDVHKTAIAKTTLPQITPGKDRAVLTLADGKTIDLNGAANGEISRSGNISITKQKNGELVYTVSNGQTGNKNELAYNTISTPKGGQYKIVLPDGTGVWLNAASSLKYPTAFKGKERHVELNGEAYFEVAKNKDLPFTVTANEVNVKVLGTHFNIMAYKDEPSVNTTLLEGSVMLNANNKQALLVPGQQGIAAKNSEQIELKTVNVEDAVAWKNQYFSFRKESIESVMRKIERWYDVEVKYQGDMKGKVLGGSISRSENIQELLDNLELTGIVKFKIEGRTIIVTTRPNKT